MNNPAASETETFDQLLSLHDERNTSDTLVSLLSLSPPTISDSHFDPTIPFIQSTFVFVPFDFCLIPSPPFPMKWSPSTTVCTTMFDRGPCVTNTTSSTSPNISAPISAPITQCPFFPFPKQFST
ncbi:hypothetical protein BLNAU_3878 [Blattamonas nauphoetae]|uniref:Uncharacterized protein n=1 Tax=Blattamonas nauphoetae TaxID=2049346 RepID=A0ABQ9YBL1_9EUKA|nr:hypothetical protein BLNAU_3878 [Blattamonas nauphoetae]